MAPVTWNPKNYYALDAGGNIGYAGTVIVLGSGEDRFKIRNDSDGRTDMLKPVRIYSNNVVWSRDGNKMVPEGNEGGFYWQMEPLVPIEDSDEEFKARIRHIGSGRYVAFIQRGPTYYGTLVSKDEAAEVTVYNRSF